MATVVFEKLDENQITTRGILSWPIWEKEVSRFDLEYDGDEECYILEGEVVIETEHGNFTVRKGDFVTFQKGLKCTWDIKEKIRKHYYFR